MVESVRHYNSLYMEDLTPIDKIINNKGFYVYKGLSNKGKLMYIGTTIQIPKDRFRWHKYNGKNLDFHVINECNSESEMLDLEYKLIKKYNPPMNKIKSRRQNFNISLSKEEVDSRRGNSEWCQCCLKRRVNEGYKYCYYCNRNF